MAAKRTVPQPTPALAPAPWLQQCGTETVLTLNRLTENSKLKKSPSSVTFVRLSTQFQSAGTDEQLEGFYHLHLKCF